MPDGEGLLGLEGAVAVAQQHAHGAAVAIGDDEVGLAVAVEVGHRHANVGLAAGGEGLLGLEGAVAVAQQHAHRVAAVSWRRRGRACRRR